MTTTNKSEVNARLTILESARSGYTGGRVPRFSIIAGALALVLGYGAAPSFATSLTESSVLSNYSVVSVGPNASITINSGPTGGNVLLGDGTTTSSSGGGNGSIGGTVYLSGVVNGDDLLHIQTTPNELILPSTVATQAFNAANALSSTAAGLAATQNFTNINGTQLILGNGGLNVIDVASLHNPLLTIKGNASDVFVFNIAGTFQTNQVMTLQGVTASQILWNFTTPEVGTNVFQTSGGDTLYGTFLDTNGGDFQFSNLNLTGQLINTDGHMQIVSGSGVPNPAPFTPTPEPATFALLGSGLVAFFVVARRSRLKAAKVMVQ